MKLLLVTGLDAWSRSVATVHKYVAASRALGHDVAVYGEPNAELPALPFTTDLSGIDLALFIVQVPSDFPDMPYLARVLDGVPRERRAVVDLWGRYNDTIRVDHDFNHLEKLDGHLGSEWIEAIQAVSDTVLQPTLAPLRPGVKTFLFHGYDAASVAKPYATAWEAAAAWRTAGAAEKPYGVMYVGSNWHRWHQVRRFLEQYGPARETIGQACLIGWDWSERPDWAVKKGIAGIDTDPAFLSDLGVDVYGGVRFDEVTSLLAKARFAPIFHRPLFRKLGIVANRTFETFYADSLPVLMLPREFVEAIYGPAALKLVPGDDVAAHLTDALARTRIILGRCLADSVPLGATPLLCSAVSGDRYNLRRPCARPESIMNILFVMEHRGNAGNTHALANYVQVGEELGHNIALYAEPQPNLTGMRFSTDVHGFDRVIYLFESKLYRVKPLQEVALLATIPRAHRYILDADGKYNPMIVVDGYDRNYLSERERAEWLQFYDALADQIIKPTLAPSDDPRVTTLPFFGFNPSLVIDAASIPPKQYDVLHVGHNWWRWKEVSEELLPAFNEIRPHIGEIGFLGLWWDGPPEWVQEENLEPAFRVDTETFHKLGIRVGPAVPYTQVIRTMSTGRVNIFTQRPFLHQVKHLTLRYFEEFCADTIPLLMLDSDLAEAVYGPAGRELTLPGRVAEKILDALQRPDHYRGLVAEVRRFMLAHHPYSRRVEELVSALSD